MCNLWARYEPSRASSDCNFVVVFQFRMVMPG